MKIDLKNETLFSFVKDQKGEKIYEHILNCLAVSSPSVRLAVLLHDSGKVKTMELRNNFFGAREFVENIVEKNLGISGLGYSKEVVSRVVKIIKFRHNIICIITFTTCNI
mgnify:CR=1 FL=1